MLKNSKHIYATHTSEYQIQFFDVDSMEIMWHGNYVKYLEMARCAFLEEIAYSYDVMKDKGYAWPVVQLNLKYIQPCLFKQRIKIVINVVEYETCLRLDYIIYDAQTNKRLTKASTTQAAVDIQTGELQFQTPSSFCQALEAYPGFTPLT